MNVKTDTKEKFTVFTPLEQHIPANMSASFKKMITENLEKQPPHLIINFSNVMEMDPSVFLMLMEMHEVFYASDHSFVICGLNDNLTKILTQEDEWSGQLNITPTESEAWDMVQMEEIERELMNDFEDND